MQFTGFEFDLDILYRAHRKKIPIIETGVVWEDRKGSKVNPLRDGFRMLRSIILIKQQKRMEVSSDKNKIHVYLCQVLNRLEIRGFPAFLSFGLAPFPLFFPL
jgi:hypothetical protein